MFHHVVWATDGSAGADRALALARELVQDSGGELTIAHCEEVTLPLKFGGSFPAQPDEEELKAKIEGQRAELAQAGIAVTLEIARAHVGGAAHSIAEVAANRQADVIVIGTRGHTPLGGLLLGSVTQRLLHIAPCPVLVVPSAREQAQGPASD